MKNGDILYRYSWHMQWTKMKAVPFRFRAEPVPGMGGFKGSYFGCYYKTPRTTNERKQWYASEGYGRLKRSAHMLPEAWDDYPRGDRYNKKSWKKSRKVRRQWQKNL